jgi:hypothetical protein
MTPNCIRLIVSAVLSWRAHAAPEKVSTLKKAVVDNEPVMLMHVTNILNGQIEKIPGTVTYPPPQLSSATSVRFIYVTMDSNTNFYFVSNQSFATFNIGVVYNLNGLPLLGDRLEPRIRTNFPLVGKWLYYHAY